MDVDGEDEDDGMEEEGSAVGVDGAATRSSTTSARSPRKAAKRMINGLVCTYITHRISVDNFSQTYLLFSKA